MRFRDIIDADVQRQFHFSGRSIVKVGVLHLLKVCASPRFLPVLIYRLAFWFAQHRLRMFGKVFSFVNFWLFGLEIGLDCEIGPGLYFPHTVGTVIGARKIGANAVIYHNVTLGAKTPDLAYQGELRPEVGDNAFLGAGCKILGGITLGDKVTVGANAVVLASVPPGSLVGGVPARVLKSTEE